MKMKMKIPIMPSFISSQCLIGFKLKQFLLNNHSNTFLSYMNKLFSISIGQTIIKRKPNSD